jgi:glycosyltransferase involved in cell wall biosynthesis
MSSARNISSISSIVGGTNVAPRLCLFTDSEEPSGMGEHMLALAAALKGEYHISFVCPPTRAGRSFLERAAQLGVETLPLAAPYDNPGGLKTLRDWLEARHFDLFHCHAGIGWEGFGGVEAARAAGVPKLVRTEHLPYLLTHPVQRADHQRIVGSVDRLICVSQEARASYIKAGVPAAKISVVYNGITLQPAKPNRAALLTELDLPSTARLVLTVGRMVAQKGYDILLEAIPAVLERTPNAHFIWAGDGPLHGELHASRAALGVAANLHLLGRRRDVPALMAAADLFVLPSRFEGFPLSVLEAMSAALPVVGTRVCGSSEAIVDGVSGQLVPPEQPAALAAAISEVLAQPTLAARWGAAGRELVYKRFSASRMARETGDIYQELLAGVGGLLTLPSLSPANQ